MGGLGHSKVVLTWGIPSPSYIKSSGSHTTAVQTPNTTHGEKTTSFDAYNKAIEWFLHHMNNLVLFRRYT